MRQAFEDILRDDLFDTTTRLVFADWLEENGLDDEANEQRRMATPEWQASARWLTDFAARCGTTIDNYIDYLRSSLRIYYRDHPDARYRPAHQNIAAPDEEAIPAQERELTFADMIQAGRDWVEHGDVFVQQGSERARDLLMWSDDDTRDGANLKLFWHHWQIVTGTRLDPELTEDSPFSCSC